MEQLKPIARRNRTHSGKKRQGLEASLRRCGMLNPVTINSSNVIIDGNLRYEIAQKFGF